MCINFTARFEKNNKGINELFKLLGKKGRASVDFKSGIIYLYDFPLTMLDDVLSIIHENFEVSSLDLNKEKEVSLANLFKQN